MPASSETRWRPYALALTATGLTLALRVEVAGWFKDRPVLLILVLPIFLSAFVGGLGPGLVATAFASLGASYWLIRPSHSFAMVSSIDTWDWLILILVGVSISTLTEVRLRQAAVILRDLAERKRAEEASALLAALVGSSTDAIVSKDLHSNVTSWNAGAEKMFGYAPGEMIGRSITVLIPPENQAEEDEILARIRRGERVQHFETARVCKNGSLIQVSVTVSPIKDSSGVIIGASNVARDISERKKTEARALWLETELHATDRRLADIVQGMTEACFAVDAQWRFTFVNDRVETLLNHRREEMLGRTLWDVFPVLQGSSPAAINYRRAMNDRVPVVYEVYSPTSARWLDVRVFPTGDGIAVFLLDIQARKMAELERENFVSLVENSAEFIGMRNLQGVPVFINRAAMELVGLE
ncbi:MAG TPA: PAS domain S-box protein, partial [Polyangiaceae bacterium]|nr:PAS domain S-box protein [Polyangiaceae bacterium]